VPTVMTVREFQLSLIFALSLGALAIYFGW
jgi:hypothetical protein